MTSDLENEELYEDLFKSKIHERVEYGNSNASSAFFLDQKVPKEARILEVGGNIGTLAHKLYLKGYKDITSIDVTPSAIEYGKSAYPNIKDHLLTFDGEKIPFADETFDVVMSFDVIEHLHDVDQHFKEVKRVLKKGGKYIFQTPNKIINIPWEMLSNRTLTGWRKYHCSLHTLNELKKRISKNGFKGVVSKRSISTQYNKEKMRKALGRPGLFLIQLFDNMPLILSSNFWVVSSSL